MARVPTPFAYYGLSQDFDYRKYLEERSHADHIVLAIDESTQKIVGSADSIALSLKETGISVSTGLSTVANHIDDLESSVTHGFSELSIDLGVIGGSLERLNSICESGFEILSLFTQQQNALLSELVSLTKTPEQVWAKEQYGYALHCVENGLWAEVIEYCTKAIEGDKTHTGYKLEPKFHFLRGSIFIGGGKIDPIIVDLSSAIQDFTNCARYCGMNNPQLHRKAFNNAAWATYCKGEVENAIELLLNSAPPDQTRESGETSFLLSKFLLHKGNTSAAEQHFKAAISRDELYAVRAVNDPDFSTEIGLVKDWMDEARLDLVERIKHALNENILPSKIQQLSDFSRAEGINLTNWKEISDEIAIIQSPTTSLKDCVNFFWQGLNRARDTAKSSVLESLRLLENKANNLLSAEPETKVPTQKYPTVGELELGGVGMFFGIVGGAYLAYMSSASPQIGNFELGFRMIIMGVFLIPIGGYLGKEMFSTIAIIIDIFRQTMSNRKLENSRKQVLKKYEQEQGKIAAGAEFGRELKRSVDSFRKMLKPLLE